MNACPAKYIDAIGIVDGLIENDGKTLIMSFHDVQFTGAEFTTLEPEPTTYTDAFLPARRLAACQIETEIRISVLAPSGEETASLHVKTSLPASNNKTDY